MRVQKPVPEGYFMLLNFGKTCFTEEPSTYGAIVVWFEQTIILQYILKS